MTINILFNRIESELRRNVEVNPKHPTEENFARKDPAIDSIRASERFALDAWTSTNFQITGGAVALALVVTMLVQGSPSHL